MTGTKVVYLIKELSPGKKYTAIVDGKKVSFGALGYSDYTKHKDTARKKRYIARHKGNENWKRSGVKTAGFWSRWLLWNKPTITASLEDMENKS